MLHTLETTFIDEYIQNPESQNCSIAMEGFGKKYTFQWLKMVSEVSCPFNVIQKVVFHGLGLQSRKSKPAFSRNFYFLWYPFHSDNTYNLLILKIYFKQSVHFQIWRSFVLLSCWPASPPYSCLSLSFLLPPNCLFLSLLLLPPTCLYSLSLLPPRPSDFAPFSPLRSWHSLVVSFSSWKLTTYIKLEGWYCFGFKFLKCTPQKNETPKYF